MTKLEKIELGIQVRAAMAKFKKLGLMKELGVCLKGQRMRLKYAAQGKTHYLG